jgi:hypothetical protein
MSTLWWRGVLTESTTTAAATKNDYLPDGMPSLSSCGNEVEHFFAVQEVQAGGWHRPSFKYDAVTDRRPAVRAPQK